MIHIKYAQTRLKSYLRMGIGLICFGILLIILSWVIPGIKYITWSSVGVGLVGGGIIQLLMHAFEANKHYLVIKNGVLIKQNIIPLKIKLNKIKSIREFAGDLKLKTDTYEFVVDTQIIEPTSLEILKTELMKLNVSMS